MEQVTQWIKDNKLMAGVGAAVVLLLLFGNKLFKVARRRRRRITRTLPRSVGRRRRTKPAAGSKKPWQVKGSEAARRHMARLRRMR